MLNRLAFYYSSYSVRGGDAWLDSEAAREKGITAVEQAIVIFTEVHGYGWLGKVIALHVGVKRVTFLWGL